MNHAKLNAIIRSLCNHQTEVKITAFRVNIHNLSILFNYTWYKNIIRVSNLFQHQKMIMNRNLKMCVYKKSNKKNVDEIHNMQTWG